MTNGAADARPIKIAITALGGQGGGVLTEWIVKLGERAGYIAQSTSVPGVAQRTGATVYYVELFSKTAADAKGKAPVLALMPVPGDVDIVLAAEMMEAGRALSRGFVSNKTVLIASTHRVYAIGEKSAMGDGRQPTESIETIAEEAAGRCVWADMESAASSSGAVISAVMFGALAGSGALPIAREEFEATIRASGKFAEINIKGFAIGFDIARASTPPGVAAPKDAPAENSAAQPAPAVAPLLQRVNDEFPAETHLILREGLKKIVDFQDLRYGALYLDRVGQIKDIDANSTERENNWRLTKHAAKHLALWMSYEDSIRVADLKTRASRFGRFRKDVRAQDGQIVRVSEYLHPRVEELCDILPANLAERILSTAVVRKTLARIIGGGRRISTTSLRGFLPLYGLASLRFLRRASYRYKVEQQRIEQWLALISQTAPSDYDLACEIAGLQRLIKGYGDTHARGVENFGKITASLEAVRRESDAANTLAGLRDAALADEEGAALHAALNRLSLQVEAA